MSINPNTYLPAAMPRVRIRVRSRWHPDGAAGMGRIGQASAVIAVPI